MVAEQASASFDDSKPTDPARPTSGYPLDLSPATPALSTYFEEPVRVCLYFSHYFASRVLPAKCSAMNAQCVGNQSKRTT